MKKTLFIIALAIAAVAGGCQKAANKNAVVNTNENRSVTNTNQAETNKKETETASTGSLATPTEAYKTAYHAREKKDFAALKKAMSKDVLDFLTDIGSSENKTLEDELKQMFDKPQGKTDEVRNEKITGDTAVLEYLNDKGDWQWMDSVKEGGEWKLTLPNAKTPTKEGPSKKP